MLIFGVIMSGDTRENVKMRVANASSARSKREVHIR